MPIPSYTLTCTRTRVIASDVYEFSFGKPFGLTFTPGQFVLFDVPLVDNPADIQPRALSVASTPSEEELLFVAKLNPGGRISRWIVETLRPGTQVSMKGPFGLFVLDTKTSKDYLFIATGTGVAPFRSQIKHALAALDKRRMDLIFGVRLEESLFWREELVALTKQYENFFLHLALSSPSDTWTGHRGRVQTLVPQIIRDFSQKSVYVCGSPDMTKEMQQLSLEAWKVAKEDLHVEGYI